MKQIIPYYRFSSIGQNKDGGSIARQKLDIENYSKQHSIPIATGEIYSDNGISGFKSHNIKYGKLGLLLDLLESGKLGSPHNLIIVVSALDRLTRASIMDAMDNVIKPILATGCTLATVRDGQHYVKDDLNDLSKLMMLQIGLNSAHQYSKSLSYHVKSAYNRMFDQLKNDGRCLRVFLPSWIEYTDSNKTHMQLKYPQADSVKLICNLSLQGLTCTTITDELIKLNMPTCGRATKWNLTAVNRILSSPSLHGQFYSSTRDLTVDDYYPVVITQDEYNIITAYRSNRTVNGRGKRLAGNDGKIFNLYSGLLQCGCGAGMSINRNGSFHHALRCNSRSQKGGCDNQQTNYKNFEHLLLNFINVVDLQSIFNPDANDNAQAELLNLNASLVNVKKNIENIQADIETEYSRELSQALRQTVKKRDYILEQINKIKMNSTVIPEFIKYNVNNLMLNAGHDNNKLRAEYKSKLMLVVDKIVIDHHLAIFGNTRTVRVYFSNGDFILLNLNKKLKNNSAGLYYKDGESINL
nr:recombinase family protein [Moritella viscosa]SHO03587.1 Resolvase, N terminal domain protein [Moritella viscosa]